MSLAHIVAIFRTYWYKVPFLLGHIMELYCTSTEASLTGFYHFCVQQFMQLSLFLPHSHSLSFIIYFFLVSKTIFYARKYSEFYETYVDV